MPNVRNYDQLIAGEILSKLQTYEQMHSEARACQIERCRTTSNYDVLAKHFADRSESSSPS